MIKDTRPRSLLAALALVGLLGVGLGTAGAQASMSPEDGVFAVTTSRHMHEGAPAPDAMTGHETHEGPAATATLREARDATRAYRDLQEAMDHGYGLLTDQAGIACIDMPGQGGMGVHFANRALVGDPAIALRRPEVLVYRPDTNGILRLSALEYVVIASAWDATHDGPPWLFGQRFMLNPAGNRFGLPAFYSLHVWAWQHNPSGAFAPYNPKVTCSA